MTETACDRDLIDAYLDDLASRLHGPPDRVRLIVEEAEAHLCDAAEAATATAPGTDPIGSSAIQQQVIDGFGSPAQVARAHNQELLRPAKMVGPVGLLSAQVVCIGLVAIGCSAFILSLVARMIGRNSTFADPLGMHASPGTCAHWLHLHPLAANCADALTAETADDAIVQRALAGVLGLLVLAAVLLVRRWKPAWSHSVIPRGTTPALALIGFLPAALALFGVGVDRVMVSQGRGAGMWLADGVVSLLAAAVCIAILVRDVLGGRTRTPLAGAPLR